MEDLSKTLYLIGAAFLALGLWANINPDFPRLPGDIYINKPGFRLYIPVTSALILSVVVSLLANLFKR